MQYFFFQLISPPDIICVKKSDVSSFGGIDPGVAGFCRSSVLRHANQTNTVSFCLVLFFPLLNPALNQLYAAVLRTIINQQQFPICIGLIQNCLNRLLYELCGIVYRNDNADHLTLL